MSFFFFLPPVYVVTQNRMNQRIKGMRENAANRHFTQHLPRVRQVLGYKDDERSLSLREYTGYSGRRHDACTNNI